MAVALLLSLACVFGATIGTRHSVAVLILAFPIVIATVCWLAIHVEIGLPAALLWQLVTVTGLQVGYLAGGYLSAWDARQLVRG